MVVAASSRKCLRASGRSVGHCSGGLRPSRRSAVHWQRSSQSAAAIRVIRFDALGDIGGATSPPRPAAGRHSFHPLDTGRGPLVPATGGGDGGHVGIGHPAAEIGAWHLDVVEATVGGAEAHTAAGAWGAERFGIVERRQAHRGGG